MLGRFWSGARLVWRASRRFYQDGCFDQAAVIAFFSLLSLVPLLLLMMSLGAFVLGSADLASVGTTSLFQSVVQDLDPRIIEEAQRVSLETGHEWAFFVFALWTASKVFSKVQSSLDRILGVAGNRSYPLRKLVVFAMVLGLGVVVVTMILVESGMSLVERRVTDSSIGWIVSTPAYHFFDRWGTRHAIPWATTVLGFLIIYRLLPARALPTSVGLACAVTAGSVWEIMKYLFSYYVGHVASYTETYGTLEAVVVFLVWVQLSASVLLWGAELGAAMLTPADAALESARG